jgi:two-component system, OmpR family, phosphate regulon sensor histidine kinase PhoR
VRRRSPFLFTAVLTFVLVLGVVVALELTQRAAAEQRLTAGLTRALELLAPNGERLFAAPAGAADAEIRRWAAASGLRVTLIAADGRVVADSWTLPELLGRLENHRQRAEIVAASAGHIGVSHRHSATTDQALVYVAIQVGPPEQPAGFLRLAASDERHRGVPWGGVIAALLAALVAAWAAQVRSRRLDAAVARHLLAWTDLPPTAAPEAMAEESDRRFRELREEMVRELEATRAALAEVAEGVIMLDGQAVVRFTNPAAATLLGADLAVGRPLVEAVRAPELVSTVGEALRTGVAGHTSVSLPGGGELAARVRPVPHPLLAAAVVLRDLREQRQLERARRALVADLAHELRTPLTVLGGLAEEFRETGTESELVATLERQVVRLRTFAEELEELTALESGQVPLHRETVDLAGVAGQVLRDLEPEAQAAGVTLSASGGATAQTDPVRLAQVLTNLVENGIRYNRRGGTVRVRVGGVEDTVRIDVEDDGIGIPAADIPLVFQRFYRVRRGAGQHGGSGLGLAIVKHLTRALGGTVQLASQEGAGTTVTLTFSSGTV